MSELMLSYLCIAPAADSGVETIRSTVHVRMDYDPP